MREDTATRDRELGFTIWVSAVISAIVSTLFQIFVTGFLNQPLGYVALLGVVIFVVLSYPIATKSIPYFRRYADWAETDVLAPIKRLWNWYELRKRHKRS